MVSGQWISFSSSSVSFFSRGKAWTSSAARRVSMMEVCCRTCREASSVKASGNKRLGLKLLGSSCGNELAGRRSKCSDFRSDGSRRPGRCFYAVLTDAAIIDVVVE